MGKFWSTPSLQGAVERLSNAGVQSRLHDFLVFKRALVLARASSPDVGRTNFRVTTGTRSGEFVQSINEWTAVSSEFSTLPEIDNPYFVPFGANRDTTKGYRSKKYTSNGPSDTVSRWQSGQIRPFVLVPDTKPKAFQAAPLSSAELKSFFVMSSAQSGADLLPAIADVAAWWFRFSNLEERFGEDFTVSALIEGLILDCSLSATERSALFSGNEDSSFDVTDNLAHNLFDDFAADPAHYLPTPTHTAQPPSTFSSEDAGHPAHASPDGTGLGIGTLPDFISSRGFTFEPWQLATYVAAVRTKPFIILAGISGTGKTKLPRLVAEATGAECETVPVRPDWHDSSELLGYSALSGDFVPGRLLRFAKQAMGNPERQYFLILDEMNIARVEYYLAEVLSKIEERKVSTSGSYETTPFFPELAGGPADEWSTVHLPGNLCLVGSVNMDESTYTFSKKVLDRAFVIEFSTINLSAIGDASPGSVQPEMWSSDDWRPSALRLSEHSRRTDPEVNRVISALTSVNDALTGAQLQVGYRVRDEVAMFCLEAEKFADQFTTSDTGLVDPLDVAIAMKVLPRVQGSGSSIRRVLEGLLTWSSPDDATGGHAADTGQLTTFPFCEQRVQLMQNRLKESGFANFWI